MRFRIKLFLAVCLVSSCLLFIPIHEPANSQLPQCTCGNSGLSTCADGFEVTFVGATMSNTLFTYTICNVDTMECNAPMALSHADILIANPDFIANPGTDITTTIIGTDGVTTRACDAPTDKDKSCGKDIDNLSELLIKCDMTDGIFEPTNPANVLQLKSRY